MKEEEDAFARWFAESKKSAESLVNKKAQNNNQSQIEDQSEEDINSANDEEEITNQEIAEQFENDPDADEADEDTNTQEEFSNEDSNEEEENVDEDDSNTSAEGYQYFNGSNEEEEAYDPIEDSLFYGIKNKNSDSIMNDILGNNSSEEEEDDDDVPQKADFAKLTSNFQGGKLNKKLVVIIFGVTILLSLLWFFASLKAKEKRQEELNKVEKTIDIAGYEADYGNYKERAYKPTEEDKKASDLAYAEKVLDSKKEYTPQPQNQQPKKASPGAYQTQKNGGVSETYKAARDSPIAVASNGFGRKKRYLEAENSGTNSNSFSPSSFNPSMKNDYMKEYMEGMSSMTEKLGGINNSRDSHRWSEDGRYDKNAVGGNLTPIPENSIYPGTVLQAVLVSGINTDYPGTITARIISPIYDSKTGKNLLIPQGSTLRGSYSSSSIGVSRVQIAWQTLIINRDGLDYVVNLGSMVGVDPKGYSGIKGSLNDHAFQYVRAAGLSCLFTLINSNIFTYTNAQKNKLAQEMIADSQEIGNKLADKLMERALDIQPTVYVPNTTKINVDVDKILTLVPFKKDRVTEPYVRK